MTTPEALLELTGSTADAMVAVLEQFAPGRASHAVPTVVADAATALASPPTPGLAASVAYIDGVSGGNVVLLFNAGARALAAAMMGGEPDPEAAPELSELELSAVAEAMNQMMASAAAETSRVLGYEVEIGTPETVATGESDLAAAFQDAAHVTACDLVVCGQPLRFVQLIPHAFVVRLTKALEEQPLDVGDGTAAPNAEARDSLRALLSASTMRVSAEIGRTRMPVDDLIGMPNGTIVELDREADDPVDVYVNGRRFAEGRLILSEELEWAVRIERVLGSGASIRSPQEGDD